MSDVIALFLLFKFNAEWYWWLIFAFCWVGTSTMYESRWNRIKEFLNREDKKEEDRIQQEEDEKRIILK